MRRLRETDGTATHRSHIRFHLARCKGLSPLHDTLHTDATGVYNALRDAERAREDADDAVVEAMADRDRAEHAIENAIRAIHSAADLLDRENPSLGARSAIFPDTLTAVIAPDGAEQIALLPLLRSRLDSYKDEEGMAKAMTTLDETEAALSDALAAFTNAKAIATIRFSEEKKARKEVRGQIEIAHGQLRGFYKWKPALAELFFLKSRTKKKAATAENKGSAEPGPELVVNET